MPEDDLSTIQAAIDAGDAEAAERLLPLVYDELRRLAHQHMRREAPGHSLQTTALVHEAYLRLLGPAGREGRSSGEWKDQAEFLAAAALSMRRILVERARAKGRIKRGGGRRRLDLLEVADLAVDDVPAELLDLDEALTRLAKVAPQQAELVSLRFFGGLTLKEAGAVLGISSTTADRQWAFARAWLLGAMEGEL
jgi:RNA polymerase sigma factor (TIGR02999 family)